MRQRLYRADPIEQVKDALDIVIMVDYMVGSFGLEGSLFDPDVRIESLPSQGGSDRRYNGVGTTPGRRLHK